MNPYDPTPWSVVAYAIGKAIYYAAGNPYRPLTSETLLANGQGLADAAAESMNQRSAWFRWFAT